MSLVDLFKKSKKLPSIIEIDRFDIGAILGNSTDLTKLHDDLIRDGKIEYGFTRNNTITNQNKHVEGIGKIIVDLDKKRLIIIDHYRSGDSRSFSEMDVPNRLRNYFEQRGISLSVLYIKD